MEDRITPVRFVKSHSEFFNYIESFPDQKKMHDDVNGVSQKELTLDYLRKELVDLAKNPKAVQDRLCYRTCFKWGEREYIQYCLDQKCGGTNFYSAANSLGLLK